MPTESSKKVSSQKLWGINTGVGRYIRGCPTHLQAEKMQKIGRKNLSTICVQNPMIGAPSCAQVTPERAQCASVRKNQAQKSCKYKYSELPALVCHLSESRDCKMGQRTVSSTPAQTKGLLQNMAQPLKLKHVSGVANPVVVDSTHGCTKSHAFRECGLFSKP